MREREREREEGLLLFDEDEVEEEAEGLVCCLSVCRFTTKQGAWRPSELVARALLPPGVASRAGESASEVLEAWIWEYVAPANASERFGDWLRGDAQRERRRPATRAAELREGGFATCFAAFSPASRVERVLAGKYDWMVRHNGLACPGQTASTSSFHLFNYLAHLKGDTQRPTTRLAILRILREGFLRVGV